MHAILTKKYLKNKMNINIAKKLVFQPLVVAPAYSLMPLFIFGSQ